MKFLQIFFLLFIPQILYSQTVKDTFTIDIRARSSAYSSRFNINIQRSSDQIKIVYAVRDSLSDERLKDNKDYATLSKQFLTANEERDKDLMHSILYQLDSIEITSYTKDSIVFKPSANRHYTNLINEINTASTEQLENKEANKKRIVVDGTLFRIKIQSASGSRIIYANSPRENSHPLLTKFINKTMDIYRDEKQNTFLDKRKTSGY